MTSADITAEQQQTVTASDPVVGFLRIFWSAIPVGMLSRQLLSVVPGTGLLPAPKYLAKWWEQAVMQVLVCSPEMSFRF